PALSPSAVISSASLPLPPVAPPLASGAAAPQPDALSLHDALPIWTRGGDGRHRCRRGRRIRPDLPVPRLLHGRGQVRPRAVAEPRPTPNDRCGHPRLAAEDRHRLGLPGPGARAGRTVTLARALGRALVGSGIRHGFGVVGSGNFHLTRAFADAGGRFTAARHEGGAATMADAYARTSGEVAMLSVHQGCGYTNAITGIAEAAKSRTPMVVLAPAAM